MIESRSGEVVALQSVWGRSHTGRVLRENAMDILSSEYDETRGLCECPNCGFTFGEEFFAGGCPNCNSLEAINNGE